MSVSKVTEGVSRWIDMVAETVVAVIGRLQPARRTQFVEEDGDVFTIHHALAIDSDAADARCDSVVSSIRLLDSGMPEAPKPSWADQISGSDIEVMLRPTHFLVRPLELPKRAGEFLDGIVRSQIDRLTPWSAADAAFGWTPPVAAPDDRIALTIVATARARIAPYVEALTGFGAKSIAVLMRLEDGAENTAPVKVFETRSPGALGVARVRRWLLVVLAGASLATAVATVTAQFVGDDLDAQTREVNRRITERRSALTKSRGVTGGATTAQHALERRKHESAASVMVLEALSQVLPDHTYMTELRVEGNKVQIIGITREAPSLIRLMEESPHFTRATFFAPTTRSPGDPGERFHIEARINPVFAASQ